MSSTRAVELTEGWTLASAPPGAFAGPDDLPADLAWSPARVPGTVASAVRPDEVDGHGDYDASDWWYRCPVGGLAAGALGGGRARLRFDGLATLADVWLNGEPVLTSSNMFLTHEVDVTDLLRADNELVIAFRSLRAALSQRRPRPRWKTRLVDDQQLRWHRTTLLGRMPGWTPSIAPVGPWRPVWLERADAVDVEALHVRATLDDGAGVVTIAGTLRPCRSDVTVTGARLHLGDRGFDVRLEARPDGWEIRGEARLEDPELWWPRTHGEPALHPCTLRLDTSAGAASVECGPVGFRDVRVDRSDGAIRFVVNGVPVFCRGACWTSNDIVSLVGSSAGMRRTLELAAGAHANMVRVGGTMVYETPRFYRACDELGLMVWQDFMFANMDYPVDDEAFAASIAEEAEQQLRRLGRHPSVVAYCGGSEVEQQAAMFGAPREVWSNDFFSRTLPGLVETHAAGTPYWPSTPTGGALPFHVGEGLTHYYGVGAYLRPLEDVRVAGVRFSPECLGLSHVPEADNLRSLTPRGAVPPHHPAWKAGVPRDQGAGWDFEDVRDHYLERLYGVDPVRLRSEDLERYLALSRSVTGEVVAHVFAEWRSGETGCGGGLVWFLNDLRPGAGWGVIDSEGGTKAAYHHLSRAWAPRAVRLLDRGLDGLVALVLNDRAEPLDCVLELVALDRGSTPVAEASLEVRVEGRSCARFGVESAFGHFVDSTYSYRFGPPRHEAVVARLLAEGGSAVLAEDVYRPVRGSMSPASHVDARASAGPDGRLTLTLSTDTLLHGVHIDVRDHRARENHFCLTPGRTRVVALERVAESTRPFLGHVQALNLVREIRIEPPA